jgi:large subunit ribosomal protein L18
MSKENKNTTRRIRRKAKIRGKVSGSTERYRLSVYRSLNHIYAQIIDDVNMHTVISASTLDKVLGSEIENAKTKIDKSKAIGAALAKRAADAKITKVAFDRNGYLYHGRVKALAESARENGLEF